MPYEVELSPTSDRELRRLRLFDQRRVAEAMKENLVHEPGVPSRNRKCLGDQVTADFEYVPPLWELRVGDFRAFYEIDDEESVVYVHAVRRKPPGKTTAEVLNETDDD